MTGATPKEIYSRREVRRVLHLSERQLQSWEKHDLIAKAEQYDFFDLVTLRGLDELRRKGLRPATIRKALSALREKLTEIENPMVELRVYSEGRQIRVQHGRQTLEPITGQLLLDFDARELQKLLTLPAADADKETPLRKAKDRAEADLLFQQALEREHGGAVEEAIDLYKKVIELNPDFAAAYVNLGTIYFTARDLRQAERSYRRAVQAEPKYALAYFNLGNLYDELGDRAAAMLHYQSALKLDPNYADAHYNVALLFQAAGQTLKAVHHWKTYLKLDPTSPWAAIAKRELDRIYRETVVETKGPAEPRA